MAKAKPFTVRLSAETEEWLERQARRSKMPKGALLESLADEAIQTRRFPGLSFRGPEHDRRAWVVGTGLDVWEIVEACHQMSRERLVSETSLSERQVDLALAYYEHHSAQIDELLADNERPLEWWQARYPGLALEPANG